MDYSDIVKRALRVTWRHKVLWVFGFFVGAGGFGGGNSGYSFGDRDLTRGSEAMMRAQAFVRENLALLIGVGIAVGVICLIMSVIGIAARGGLVRLVDDAEEGRDVRAGVGWDVGFSKWGRVFLIELVLLLPMVVLVLAIAAFIAVAITGVAGARLSVGSDLAAAAGGALLAGGCGALVLVVLVVVPVSFVIGLMYPLALRYGVLSDLTAGRAFSAAWQDVRHRFKDVVLMWLVMVGAGILFGVMVGIAAAMLAVPVVVAVIARLWPVVAVLGVLLLALMLLVCAAYGAFVSAAWTVFFRRLTGREAPVSTAVPLAAAG